MTARVTDIAPHLEDAERERQATAAGHEAYVALVEAMAEEARQLKADPERPAYRMQTLAMALSVLQGPEAYPDMT